MDYVNMLVCASTKEREIDAAQYYMCRMLVGHYTCVLDLHQHMHIHTQIRVHTL